MVTKEDRAKTGFDDNSYPVATHQQRMSAIKLRGHSKSHSKSEVLSHVMRAARKAKDTVAIRAVEKARENDKS